MRLIQLNWRKLIQFNLLQFKAAFEFQLIDLISPSLMNAAMIYKDRYIITVQ